MNRSRWLIMPAMAVMGIASCQAAEVPKLATDIHASPWHLATAVTPATSTLHLLVEADHCGDYVKDVHADVSYLPSAITIITTVTLPACLTGPSLVPLTVELREPVGNRSLVDPSACHSMRRFFTPTPDPSQCPDWAELPTTLATPTILPGGP